MLPDVSPRPRYDSFYLLKANPALLVYRIESPSSFIHISCLYLQIIVAGMKIPSAGLFAAMIREGKDLSRFGTDCAADGCSTHASKSMTYGAWIQDIKLSHKDGFTCPVGHDYTPKTSYPQGISSLEEGLFGDPTANGDTSIKEEEVIKFLDLIAPPPKSDSLEDRVNVYYVDGVLSIFIRSERG